MFDLPVPVQAHVHTCCLATRAPAYLLVHRDGRLQEWHGALDSYGLTDLQSDVEIGQQVPCLAGLWPFEGSPWCMPGLETTAGTFADIHLFPAHTDVWVLFLDATAQVVQQRRWQQKANEMVLLQEYYSAILGKHLGPDVMDNPVHVLREALTTAALFTHVFEALGVVVLERMADGAFRLMSNAPAWLIQLYPAVASQREGLRPDSIFPGLRHFLREAEVFWSIQGAGQRTSPPWSARDMTAQEHHLEASALCLGKHQLLCLFRLLRPTRP